MKPTTIGLDLGKNALQIHGIDAEGRFVVRKQLRRRDVLALFANLSPCLLVSRLVRRPITGHVSSPFSATKCV